MSATEQRGGGEVAAAKRAKAPDDGAGGEDLLSALPDDVLVLILLRLDIDTRVAARTSILSRRWRRVWTLLPNLYFRCPNYSECPRYPEWLRDALSASEVPLRSLLIQDPYASPQSLATWLPAAARRVAGELILVDSLWGRTAADVSQRDTFELPCFEKATRLSLCLGFLGLTVPPAGVFARLTDLNLSDVTFHGPGNLGDVVSSPRCPCLQKLTICNVLGMDNFTIHSESLEQLDLKDLREVLQVSVVAPVLKYLALLHSFFLDQNQPVVNISAPQLKSLKWADAYDPSSVHLGSMENLEMLSVFFSVYGLDVFAHNSACLMLLPQFNVIENLNLFLGYVQELNNSHCLMEDITMLPHSTSLQLNVMATGHAFGASVFHVLRICSGIKRLALILSYYSDYEEQFVCSSHCICRQLTIWKTEELLLNHLQELEIEGFRGSEHEIAFLKPLPNWVTDLKMIRVTFSRSVTKSKANELFQMFKSFSRPGVSLKFYFYDTFGKVPFVPEG